MTTANSHLITAVLGQRVLERFATTHGVSVPTLRVLGLVAVLHESGLKVSARKAAPYLDCHYFTALAGANECCAKGWLERQDTKGWGLRVTLEGLRIVGLIERAEREARVKVQRAELPKWPRKYVRKAATGK